MSRRAIAVEVTRASTIRRMTLVRRILQALGATLAFAVCVWFEAVRLAPSVKRRKAARRARRRGAFTGS